MRVSDHKTAQSGRGDGIAPVTPPTPPGMRVCLANARPAVGCLAQNPFSAANRRSRISARQGSLLPDEVAIDRVTALPLPPGLHLRFFFYSNDHTPIHVHVKRGDGEAVFFVEGEVVLRESVGMKTSELAKAEDLAIEALRVAQPTVPCPSNYTISRFPSCRAARSPTQSRSTSGSALKVAHTSLTADMPF